MKFMKYLSVMMLAVLLPLLTSAQDDLYYTPDYSDSNQYTDGQGDTYVTNNNYYGGDDEYVYYEDDDYDYYYSSRIRRFHRPYNGFGYYGGCYVDNYWYNPDPFFWGSNIYASSFYRPRPFISINWGWGNFYRPWRHNHYHYSSFYNPYTYGHNPYGAYGYTNGYYNPYNAGNTYIYNDYGNNSSNATTVSNNSNNSNTSYGPRPDRAGYTGGSGYGDRPDYGVTNSNDNESGKQGRGGVQNNDFNVNTIRPTNTNTGYTKGENDYGIYEGKYEGKPNTVGSSNTNTGRSDSYKGDSSQNTDSYDYYKGDKNESKSYNNSNRGESTTKKGTTKWYKGLGKSITKPNSDRDRSNYNSSKSKSKSKSYSRPSSKSRSYSNDSGKSRSSKSYSSGNSRSKSKSSSNSRGSRSNKRD